MPLTKKGQKTLNNMKRFYSEKGGLNKGEQVFYASINKGRLKGMEGKHKK